MIIGEFPSGRWWGAAKRGLSFAPVTPDGDDEGALFIDRLPTPEETETIRHYVVIAKRRTLNDGERARLAGLGRRFEKRSSVGSAVTGEKTASDDMAGLMAAEAGEGVI